MNPQPRGLDGACGNEARSLYSGPRLVYVGLSLAILLARTTVSIRLQLSSVAGGVQSLSLASSFACRCSDHQPCSFEMTTTSLSQDSSQHLAILAMLEYRYSCKNRMQPIIIFLQAYHLGLVVRRDRGHPEAFAPCRMATQGDCGPSAGGTSNTYPRAVSLGPPVKRPSHSHNTPS